MASPQKENGFTPISNELLDALAASKLTGLELRFIMHLLRNTYGYSRKEYTASLSEIGDGIGVGRISVKKTADRLLAHRVIVVTPQGNRQPVTYRLNKNYDVWCYPTGLQSAVTPQGNNLLPHKVTPIIRKKKEIIKDNFPFRFKKAVPLPKNFKLTEDMVNHAKKKNFIGDLDGWTENMMLSASAKGYKYKDWHATWKNWFNRHIEAHPNLIEKETEWADI